MGEMADYFIDQMQFPFDDGFEYEPPVDRTQIAVREFSTYKETKTMADAKTYKFTIDSTKGIYRIMPPLARGSFMQRIIEPEAYKEGDDKEWGCQLRWKMDDPEVKAWAGEMIAMFRQLLTDKFGKDKGPKLLEHPNFKVPLRNGDHEDNDEYHGHLFMNVRNKFRRPLVIGPTGDPLEENYINDSVIYSGAWYRSRLVFRYYDVKSKGIGAYIEVLMKIKDDVRLDNVVDAAAAKEDFAAFATDDVDALSPPDDTEDFKFL